MGLFQRGGEWYIDHYVAGRRKREKVGPNKALANRIWAKRQMEALERREFPEHAKLPPMPFTEMVDLFWELYAQHKRGVSRRYMLEKAREEFGQTPLDRITVPRAIEFLNRVRARTSVSTANRYHTMVRSLFNRAIEWGKFDGANPFSKIKQQKEPHHRLRFLSKAEIGALLPACSPRVYPIVVCALMTGMRRGEILRLTWDTVDFDQRVIYVLETKSGKPREIPISPKLAAVLGQLKRGPKDAKLFDVSEDVLHTEFQLALRRASITEFRFHDLRHTFASHFVMRTNDLPTLQKLLGHHSPNMTQRYAHLSKGHIQVGMQIFDAGMDSFRTPTALSSNLTSSQTAHIQAIG